MANIIEVTITATGPQGEDGYTPIKGVDYFDGADGADGANGVGVPAGGTAGQILSKIDGTDYNTEWKDNKIPAESYLALVDVSHFVVTSNLVMNTSYPQILPLTKFYGGMQYTPGSNIITLPKGYVYEAIYSFRGSGNGYALIEAQNSSAVKRFETNCLIATVTANTGDASNTGGGVLDLSASGSDSDVRFANTNQSGGITLVGSGASLIIIKKYKKITI